MVGWDSIMTDHDSIILVRIAQGSTKFLRIAQDCKD